MDPAGHASSDEKLMLGRPSEPDVATTGTIVLQSYGLKLKTPFLMALINSALRLMLAPQGKGRLVSCALCSHLRLALGVDMVLGETLRPIF